jgi:hypothetical protein
MVEWEWLWILLLLGMGIFPSALASGYVMVSLAL